MTLRAVVVLAVAGQFACNSKVRLDDRPCLTSDDCIDGYVCAGGTCVSTDSSGDSPAPPPGGTEIIDQLDLGATFVVDAGANVVNFPVRLVLDSAQLDASKLAAGASNLRFVDVEAHELIAYELVTFNAAGPSTVWLQFPELSPSKTVRIGYGPQGTPAPEDNGWNDIHMQGVWHFDGGSGAESSGQASAMSGNATAGADTFQPTLGQVLSATRVSTSQVSIEIEARPDAQSWSRRAVIELSPPTSQSEFQVSIGADGGAHKVLDGSGIMQNTWTETIDNGYVLWTRVKVSGTLNVFAYSGPTSPFTEAGYAAVLDPGLTVTRWDSIGGGPYNNQSDFDTLFHGLAYASASARTTVALVNCPGTCFAASSNGSNYAALLEGWLIVPNGTSVLGAAADDTSDILLYGTDWNVDGTKVVDDYGSHALPTTPNLSGPISGSGGPVRFQYRYYQGTGGHGYVADIGPSSPALTDIIPASSLYRRKRVASMPVATITAATVLGTVLRYGSDVTLEVTSGAVQAIVGGATLNAPGASAWSHLVITHDGSTATLYVDGVQRAQSAASPITANDLGVGDITDDAQSPGPSLDEVRFSSVVRDPTWIAAQANGPTITFQ